MKTTLTLALILFAFATVQAQTLEEQLFEAVIFNNFEQTKTLIEQGADVNATDKNGASILMWATYKGDLPLVKYLVEQKADYKYKKGVIYTNEEKTSYYGNLLGIAVGENKIDIVKYFVEDLKIDVNDIEYNPETEKADGWNALQWCASKGNSKILEYLLGKGADINANPGSSQNTALLVAVSFRKYETAKLLIEKGQM